GARARGGGARVQAGGGGRPAGGRDALGSLGQGVEGTPRAAGHQVRRLDGLALGQDLMRGLTPYHPIPKQPIPTLPLNAQLLDCEARNVSGGWEFGHTEAEGTFAPERSVQLLTLA